MAECYFFANLIAPRGLDPFNQMMVIVNLLRSIEDGNYGPHIIGVKNKLVPGHTTKHFLFRTTRRTRTVIKCANVT